MAISTKSPIVPFAIIGDYQKFKKNVKIVLGIYIIHKLLILKKKTKS